MKKSRVQRYIKKKKSENQQNQQPITRQDMDRIVFDVVLGELYENSDINSLQFDNILSKYNVQLPYKEKERIWDVLVNSMWVSPTVGFGKSGQLELTPQGYQLLSQYGTYSNYLYAAQNPQAHAAHKAKADPPTQNDEASNKDKA